MDKSDIPGFARSKTVKKLPSRKFRREEKCERKPSGCPFAFHHPPQRQNCKIMLQNLILQFWKQLGKKARRDFFDKLTRRKRSGSDCQKTCPVTSIGGKDSVKGNRQGSLSRSITRRSDQNRKIKYCFLFCDFASACQKSPFGLF